MKFSGKVGSGPVNKRLHFGGDPDHCLDTGIVFRVRHYWKIRKVINGHSFVLIRQMAAVVMKLEDTESRQVEPIGQIAILISRYW